METTPRSEQDYTDLIATLREDVAGGEYSGGGYRYVEVLPDTAVAAIAAIEALVKERDELKREMHARELHHFEEEQKSAGLAAVAEKVREAVGPNVIYAPEEGEDWGSEEDAYMEGAEHVLGTIRKHISTAPTDALAEHDAKTNSDLLAEVERLRLMHAGQSRLALSAVFMADVDDDEGVQAFYREWVRNHDAALIESLADHLDRHFQDIPAWTDAYREGVRTDEWMTGAVRMTTGAIGWLRERARQVREGEA